jgi:hypothetical protein
LALDLIRLYLLVYIHETKDKVNQMNNLETAYTSQVRNIFRAAYRRVRMGKKAPLCFLGTQEESDIFFMADKAARRAREAFAGPSAPLAWGQLQIKLARAKRRAAAAV